MTVHHTITASTGTLGAPAPIALWERTRRIGVEIDGETGLLAAILVGDGARRLPVALSATVVTEGEEVDRHPFGLAYADTDDLTAFTLATDRITHDFAGHDELFTVTTEVGGWQVDWEYRFRTGAPRIELQIVLAPTEPGASTVRNLHMALDVRPASLDGWVVEAPGSQIRPGMPASAITERVGFSENAFSGSGILVAHNAAERTALLAWPFSRTEHSYHKVHAADGGLRIDIETGLAGRITPGERLRYGAIELDLFDATWDELRPAMHTWFHALGVARPTDTAEWIPGAAIFEVQIGTSVFWRGFEYSPYPTMRDLYDDLGRIAGLGFDCIQIMPRQPFPSYNVYDYADITTSYGDEDDLRRVVEASHALGMRVILDILMHGVIDAEIIHHAADRVRSGPYAARLDEGTEIIPDDAFQAYDGQDYRVAWSRHVLDFEEHWAGGSPGEHPLVAEHPEWFIRRSDGEIIGVYTKAFDNANIAWQEYFTAAALDMVRRLDIDGFRFDAPTYNEVPNWSAATERRASASQMGAVEHFARLRAELKALKPEAMLYTEPSGTLFRQTMDITYNYDEHWLIHALMRPARTAERTPYGVRNARDLAAWMRDKEAALPAGAMTARHIDSHDTFWWPLPGFKWRREQYGLPATRALLATFSLIGGVYMTFVGGESGIEDDIRRMTRLRRELAEIGLGRADYDRVAVESDAIFAVARVLDNDVSIVLVNLSGDAVSTTVTLDTSLLPSTAATYRVYDTWNDTAIDGPSGYAWSAGELQSLAASFAPWQARVLTIRPVDNIA